jgi:hypothetical protein
MGTLRITLTRDGPELWPWCLAWTVDGIGPITWFYREDAHARYEVRILEQLFKRGGYEVVMFYAANPLDPEYFSHV